MGPFYLTVIDAPLTDVWYKNQAVGVNTISTMLSRMKKKVTISRIDNKRQQTTLQEKQPVEN